MYIYMYTKETSACELSIWAAALLSENLVNIASGVQGLIQLTKCQCQVLAKLNSSLSSTEYDGSLATYFTCGCLCFHHLNLSVWSWSWFISLYFSHKYTFLKISEPQVLSKVTMGNNLLLLLLTYLKTVVIFTFSLLFCYINHLSLFSISP